MSKMRQQGSGFNFLYIAICVPASPCVYAWCARVWAGLRPEFSLAGLRPDSSRAGPRPDPARWLPARSPIQPENFLARHGPSVGTGSSGFRMAKGGLGPARGSNTFYI